MAEIIPAIIPKDFNDLQEKLSRVASSVSYVQIDVLDGTLAPSKAWPYVKDHDLYFENILEERDGFPFWEEMDFEAHMMVDDPSSIVEDWVRVGATRILLHVESKTVREALSKVQHLVEVGLVINLDTPNEILEDLIEGVSCIQLMGIENIGYQKQPFDERVFDKLRTLKKHYPNMIFSIDGAVTLDNAGDLIDAGADRLVVGSGLFEAEDIIERLEEFQSI